MLGAHNKPIRRMYQSAAYVSAGRKLSTGLIEKRTNKTVIWLSIEEHQKILELVRIKRKFKQDRVAK